MSVSDLTPSTQNYLKTIWALTEWSETDATPTAIAERLGLRLSTVSEAIRKLSKQNLTTHTPYGAVMLTKVGRKYALDMVRRHRLIETFLVQTLGYGWDQVHEEADQLEHAVSDFMIERIDELLGRPERDPHGDPIPRVDGSMIKPTAVQLSVVSAPATVKVERIADDNPELLQFFGINGITLGCTLQVSEGLPFSGTLTVTVCADSADATAHSTGYLTGATGGSANQNAVEQVLLGRPATDALYVSH